MRTEQTIIMTKLISTSLIIAFYTFICSGIASAESTAEKRDFKITINKKSDKNGAIAQYGEDIRHYAYSTKHNGEIDTVHFEVIAQADDRAVKDPSSVSIKYEIFYFEDSESLKRGGLYKSAKGTLSLEESRDAQKTPLKTDSVKIHDTVTIKDNRRSRRRNSDDPLITEVTGERKDKLIGILVDIYQNDKLIASYSDRSRIVKIAEKLRKEKKELTPEAFK